MYTDRVPVICVHPYPSVFICVLCKPVGLLDRQANQMVTYTVIDQSGARIHNWKQEHCTFR
jgi:hypothetical protein